MAKFNEIIPGVETNIEQFNQVIRSNNALDDVANEAKNIANGAVATVNQNVIDNNAFKNAVNIQQTAFEQTVSNNQVTFETKITAQQTATNSKSESAIAIANDAKTKASQANTTSELAVLTANEATDEAQTATSFANTANSNSQIARQIATSVENRANAGEFNGRDGMNGVALGGSGIFAFNVVDDNLVLTYSGETPDMYIDTNGELIWRF